MVYVNTTKDEVAAKKNGMTYAVWTEKELNIK
jgi:hypothetical protein